MYYLHLLNTQVNPSAAVSLEYIVDIEKKVRWPECEINEGDMIHTSLLI